MLENIEFIIPCAGKSTRNYPQSKGIAHKSLLPFGSVRLIDHVLKQIFEAGGRYVTLVCSNQETIDNFKEALAPCPDIEAKLREKGRASIADALKSTEIPADARIQYVIQKKPLGTAHVLGLAHRLSKDKHACMIFPDDIYIDKDPKNGHLKKMLDTFLIDEKQILLTGIWQEDVRNNAIIDKGRLIEKPLNPSNNIGGFSPMMIPKPILDYMESKVDGLEDGTFKPFLVGNEWVYTDGINRFLDMQEGLCSYDLRMFLKDEDDLYMDTGALPLYEHALLHSLLFLSVYKEKHMKYIKDILGK